MKPRTITIDMGLSGDEFLAEYRRKTARLSDCGRSFAAVCGSMKRAADAMREARIAIGRLAVMLPREQGQRE